MFQTNKLPFASFQKAPFRSVFKTSSLVLFKNKEKELSENVLKQNNIEQKINPTIQTKQAESIPKIKFPVSFSIYQDVNKALSICEKLLLQNPNCVLNDANLLSLFPSSLSSILSLLLPTQVLHTLRLAKKMFDPLIASRMLDAPMGSGKTFVSLFLARLFQKKIILIVPDKKDGALQNKWRHVAKTTFGLEIDHMLSYHDVRGVDTLSFLKQCKNEPTKIHSTKFHPLPHNPFLERCDEYYHVKPKENILQVYR